MLFGLCFAMLRKALWRLQAEQGHELAAWNTAYLLEKHAPVNVVPTTDDVADKLPIEVESVAPSFFSIAGLRSSLALVASGLKHGLDNMLFLSASGARTPDAALRRAFKMYSRSASQGNPQADLKIAEYYYFGLAGVNVRMRACFYCANA
jgi:hypothetical protein